MSNNITPLQQPTEQAPAPAPAPQQPTPLNRKIASNIAIAYHRYLEISKILSSGVITPDTAALSVELDGIKKFLANSFLSHGGEFIGCYNIVNTEYEPLLRSIATVFGRIGLLQPAAPETAPAPATKD